MASENGIGRRIAAFFGVNISEDEYERPPVSSYEEKGEAYLSSRSSTRSLPSAGKSSSSTTRRNVYGDDSPSFSRYGYEEDDDDIEAYRPRGYEPRYSYTAGSSSTPARRKSSTESISRHSSVNSRFVEQPARKNTPAPRPPKRSEQTVMFELYELRDANKVISSLVQGNTIIFTIVNPDSTMCTRIVDTLCGAAYALRASISQASEKTYLLAPHSVSVRTANNGTDRRRY